MEVEEKLRQFVVADCGEIMIAKLLSGIDLSCWKLVSDGVVWIENKRLDLRIRAANENITVHQYFQVKPFKSIESSYVPPTSGMEHQRSEPDWEEYNRLLQEKRQRDIERIRDAELI